MRVLLDLELNNHNQLTMNQTFCVNMSFSVCTDSSEGARNGREFVRFQFCHVTAHTAVYLELIESET